MIKGFRPRAFRYFCASRQQTPPPNSISLLYSNPHSTENAEEPQYATTAPALADQRGLVTFIGICELAGAIGLIVPRLTGIMPVLSTWAAVGLATIMVLATGFHLTHCEYSHVLITLTLLPDSSFTVADSKMWPGRIRSCLA